MLARTIRTVAKGAVRTRVCVAWRPSQQNEKSSGRVAARSASTAVLERTHATHETESRYDSVRTGHTFTAGRPTLGCKRQKRKGKGEGGAAMRAPPSGKRVRAHMSQQAIFWKRACWMPWGSSSRGSSNMAWLARDRRSCDDGRGQWEGVVQGRALWPCARTAGLSGGLGCNAGSVCRSAGGLWPSGHGKASNMAGLTSRLSPESIAALPWRPVRAGTCCGVGARMSWEDAPRLPAVARGWGRPTLPAG